MRNTTIFDASASRVVAGHRMPVTIPQLQSFPQEHAWSWTSKLPASTALPKALAGKRTLVVVDAENVSFSAARHGYDCDYGLLAHRLQALCTPSLHAFATADEPGYAYAYFYKQGWQPHIQPGRGNSDVAIGLNAARMALQELPDAVLLASGDGDLGMGLLNFLKDILPQMEFHTMGLEVSLSRRLVAGPGNGIRSTTVIGRDLLCRPSHQ